MVDFTQSSNFTAAGSVDLTRTQTLTGGFRAGFQPDAFQSDAFQTFQTGTIIAPRTPLVGSGLAFTRTTNLFG